MAKSIVLSLGNIMLFRSLSFCNSPSHNIWIGEGHSLKEKAKKKPIDAKQTKVVTDNFLLPWGILTHKTIGNLVEK